ncbi:helicase with zinc finger domain 2-like [Cololabis saira]|uniref:helicase with zinc finger domain 2-like n=1 Tax=Cololabis saira TaxID=129043 RepID=UPI002AD440DD|nr:helicase with zinc finger domain 2-like [Cololabis saira]
MSASSSKLSPLLSTYDLKLACDQCLLKEKAITFSLREGSHRCARTVLLCKAKDAVKWRPVSRRPTFPNPSRYDVCRYFTEGSGCRVHQNRCTFARSVEEAAVWNFAKKNGLEHQRLCNLIAEPERKPQQPSNAGSLQELLESVELKAVCSLCSIQKKDLTYTVQSVVHNCGRNLLLAKGVGSEQWRTISERPTGGNMGPNVLYKVCDYFVEGSGCSKHTQGQGCTYAKSLEEATVWNFVKEKKINQAELMKLLPEPESAWITPQLAAEGILQQLSGKFVEFCGDCFDRRPHMLAVKTWKGTCSAEAAHTWRPVLVHHLSEGGSKHVYSQVRPLPPNCPWEFCSHVRQGKPCWHQAGRCRSAQSEVEMAVWKAEHSGLSVRPHLLDLSEPEQMEQVIIFCKICLLELPSLEKFYRHCCSLEHSRLLSQDTITTWTERQPPHNRRADFGLCDRPQTCEYGSNCPRAHSEAELQEWMMRAEEEREIKCNIEDQGLMCYNQRLLEEYRSSSNEVYIMSEQVDDVSVSCHEDLTVECDEINATLAWNFHVETENQLVHVALLKQEPGASFSLSDDSSLVCVYSSGEGFLREDGTYAITVSFTSTHPGLYEQWLVLDFDVRPVLLKKLRVRVGQASLDDTEQPNSTQGVVFHSEERWHRENRVIIPCSYRTEEQEELLKEYKPPHMNLLYKPSRNKEKALNKDNYKERMHQFLFDEEQAEDGVVSRLNVCGEITTMEILDNLMSGMAIAPQGELFCAVPVPCNLTADSPEGLVLKRRIQSALIGPLNSDAPNSKVYEARIMPHHTSNNQMFLHLSKQCCHDLGLKHNESCPMEVQFQLERHSFCTMHKAVDLLPDTILVLPDLGACGVPLTNAKYEGLNTKQQSALEFIMGNVAGKKTVAPLLIYGPFGTGKTLTLATAARELCKNVHNKVLICTHTNSSADLYVRVHFHQFINGKNNGLKPIRIKANKQGSALNATDEITLKYCLLSKDRCAFQLPTKAVLERYNVVITTTTMAKCFHDLKLAEGYFTHILVDEASQMLECEALLALGLAGPNTRVVLAGDHMQMGPQLFFVDDDQRSDYTLLTRLFHYYQGQRCDTAERNRIIFSENYRSTKEIVEFVSSQFYVGKNDVIQASGDVPPPANGHALKFCHVRGECVFDSMSMSWYNGQEAMKVVEAVNHVLQDWPSTWGPKDPGSICVLSEGCQVQIIRRELRRSRTKVNVENLANVQGKQFRVVIMTALQTRDSLKDAHLLGMPLFNDAREFNTAMTRAQSLVVVVGDAAALSCFGKCSGIWKSFIKHCINNSSIVPQHYTKEFFEKDIMETAKFQRAEYVDESSILSDAILQELRDNYEQMKTEYSSDESSLEDDDSSQRRSGESYQISDKERDLLELCEKQPDMFMRGMFVREAYNRGHFIPFSNPSRHINIQGRTNVGKAFTGDEVVIQTSKVIGIIKRAESSRELVCLLEEEDHSKRRPDPSKIFVRRTMIPIKKSAPKICILINKRKRNFIPIWDQINGYWRVALCRHVKEVRDSVFVVQVINWKETCMYPLGRVTNILSNGGPLEDRLWLHKEEFGITESTCETTESVSRIDEDGGYRQDERNTITFSVDPAGSKDLDDAISIKYIGDHYELGVHISDVASFVTPGSPLDSQAKERGSTYYSKGQEPIHMFPTELSTGHFSLLPQQDRRVVSMIFKVNKEDNKIIGKPRFQLSLINSNEQYSYEEAEDIISERYHESPRFITEEDCLTVAYCFAIAQRRLRLEDWAYSQSDDERLPGKRKAHLMIEELSVLFNKHASEKLLNSNRTRSYTPLRCQAKPDPDKVEIFKDQCRALIPLSFHVRHKVDQDEETQHPESFCILTEVWKDIQSALKANDTDKMVDLVAADDIHPQLQPVIDQFRRCSSKAYVIRYNSSPEAGIGHYSLSLENYTQASSPIRRYMDVVLQRLLHSVICNKDVQYSRTEITLLCLQFEQNIKSSKDYEQKTEQSSYAVSVKKQSASKLAFVVRADQEEDGFAVSFPFNKCIFPVSLTIMYRDLQLEDQPLHDEVSHNITLRWRRRIYAADYVQLHKVLDKMPNCAPSVEVPLTVWKAVIEAIDDGNFDDAKSLLMDVDRTLPDVHNVPQSSEPSLTQTDSSASEGCLEVAKKKIQHWVDIFLQLKPGDTVQVQMMSEMRRGQQLPAVQLVHIKQKFEICVDHIHRPIPCFYRVVHEPSRLRYDNAEEYERIWDPLCKMESCHNAVDESDSIIIEDLVVTFKQMGRRSLSGSFFLPDHWIDEWAIECNFRHCFLCIRKRGLKLPSSLEHLAVVDPREFTWVAHAVTSQVVELKDVGIKVEFFINHLPMENTPKYIFQKDASFTVEIIPKSLPDIRKESAVINLKKGCDLVKNIALGHRISKEVINCSVTRWDIGRTRLPGGLPQLNNSQCLAVETALKNTFTLIQGPPGTGKTVVGVYIVFWFFTVNSTKQRTKNNDDEKDKKEVILYCGPSNKSVDVVAEYLMKYKDSLKILRVYSQQVEVLDYPYPNCTLHYFSKNSRQERSKAELRSITMHHRMREDTNPFAAEIRGFDERIRREEDLTKKEIKKYKDLLSKARKHELKQHDIILCTCTQSSTGSMKSSVSARQILIDECAMATEPQALIPLVSNNPEQIVLIGDHKQLRPIVKNEHVKKLGMVKSLFERYYNGKRTVMLDTQYRMHEEICKFPSKEFYDNRLRTGVNWPNSVLRVDGRTMPVVFGHVKGETVRLVVKTAKGSNNSKANRRERDKVVAIAKKLVDGKVAQKNIVVLSPYNAQVSEIREELKRKNLAEILVTTIIKSQGSEWRYVILSTVCSLPSKEIVDEPDGAWLSKNLGFVGDPNQINVAITRAKEGLCIIGNQKLLRCSRTWKHLLDHYTRHNAVTKADKISVASLA